MRNVDSIEDFPLLDSFHWEILRVFPAPPFFFKVSTSAFQRCSQDLKVRSQLLERRAKFVR